jgi:hypothetical protein
MLEGVQMIESVAVVAASAQYWMPAHHPRIIARRQKRHPDDLQENSQPLL